MHELELKFGLCEEAAASLREALLQRGAERIRLRAHYFDTPDGELADHHVALRVRAEGGDWTQTLKADGDSPVQRLEHEVPVPAPRGRMPACDLARHAGTPAGEALQATLQGANTAALAMRYGTDVTRLRCTLHDAGGTTMEVALDTGEAISGARRSPIAELEIEHLAGPVQGVFDLARAWMPLGGLWLSTIAKSQRGQRLWKSEESVRPVKARTPDLARHDDGAAWLRAILHAVLHQVLGNASEAAEGVDDAELVHQLRVGLRRLRTVMRELHVLEGTVDPGWEPALAEAFAALGVRRDNEVVGEAVRPLLEAAQAPLLRWTPPPADDVAAIVRKSAFQMTLLYVLAWAHGASAALSPLASHDARQRIAERLERLHRQVAKAGKRFGTLASDEQHRVRKRLKRLRYTAELVQTLWDEDDTRRYLAHLKPAQDALGHHNDVATAAAAFRTEAERDPRAWFAAGFLQAHLDVTARKAGKSLAEVRGASPFWRD